MNKILDRKYILFLQATHQGHKCCNDNPILKNITLSVEIENWNGTKRCCMHSSGTRQLDDLDLDFQEKQDISAIVFEMHDKKVTKKTRYFFKTQIGTYILGKLWKNEKNVLH